ncbi:MAG TPA: alpha-amylase family glycosyl hydrolase [Candidatus Binatia bacterium]|nr:alpha-amylase family glycosyl hydrolase [Candidatus Binatia bacterium]
MEVAEAGMKRGESEHSALRPPHSALEWWREAVFYQIYVRSFQDANGDGIGDLAGLIERLDYLNDGTPNSLGVDALWLNPINPSPMFDFGYDVSDYCAIDPVFGTLDDLDRLVAEAHRRNMRVILDLVPNHSSHLHAWFRESRSSRTSSKRDWYTWRDPAPDGGPPNNWVSVFGGPAWEFDEQTGQYYLHSFLVEQPDLNYRNPAVVEAMENVLTFWLDRGVDGFRVDVIHKMVKDAALRSNPKPNPSQEHPIIHYGGQVHLHDEDQPEVHDVIRSWRRILDRYGAGTMVGEVGLYDPVRIAAYQGNGHDELPLAFNFPFLWTPWDAAAFRERVDEIERVWPPAAQPTYTLSNHDVPRHRSRFDDARYGDARARVAALMLLTLRGTPFVYYGDEIGMLDGVIPAERICDPVGKRFPAVGRDPCRTPMQWSGGRLAGFTTAPDAWLPLSSDHTRINVAAERNDSRSLLSFYRRLVWYRKQCAPLTRGTYRALDRAPDTFVYVREHAGEMRLVALNFASEARTIALPSGPARVELSTDPDRAIGAVPAGSFTLAPSEGVLIAL